MKIFLDFDDVIFNTKDFLDYLKSIFESFGVSETSFRSAYEEMKAEAGGLNFCYSFDGHVEKLKKDGTVDENMLKAALYQGLDEAHKFIFPDVEAFLQYLKKQKYSVNILSFGHPEYQSMKIAKSGIASLVENVLVTQESKEKILKDQDLESLENVWFFDDRVHFLESMKKSFPLMKTVLVSRPEGRFKDVKSSLCDYQIFSLEEGKEVIQRSQLQ